MTAELVNKDTDRVDLRIFGYAPGSYSIICMECNTEKQTDKRAIVCLECAEKLMKTGSNSTTD